MKTTTLPRLLIGTVKLITIGTLALSAGAAYGGSFSELLTGLKEGSKASLNVRTRYEYNETPSSVINGYSIRTRLGLSTGEYEGLKLMVEMEDLSFEDDSNRPGLDVPVTEVNQVWLSYKGAKLGRQIYTLDDQRFIGHVGWRQNIQTFDAVTYSYALTETSKLNFGYLDTVRRVNASKQGLNGFLLNGSNKFSESFSLTGFAYLLDFDNPVLASSDTYGIRGTGKIKGDAVSYDYSFSYAKQLDNSGSVRDFDLDYLAGEFAATLSGIKLIAGFEILEGNGASGFTTPLATVHKFNGFADVFAAPSLGLAGGLPQGLEDAYIGVGFKAADVPITVSYHSFAAENVSDYLGSEINLVATYKLNDYVTLLGKYADYQTNGGNSVSYGNADKQVLTLEANLIF